MSNLGIRRLRKEYENLLKDKSLVYFARPSQDNEWFDWHFTIRGPPDTPYEGGLYHGIITFPQDYPYKPPTIFFLNKSGRFGIREKVCLSFTNFHPEYWQPAWTILVENILQGLISFMDVEEEYQSVGAVTSSTQEKIYWAKKSREFECKTCGRIIEILPDTEEARKFKVKSSLPAFEIKRKESESEREASEREGTIQTGRTGELEEEKELMKIEEVKKEEENQEEEQEVKKIEKQEAQEEQNEAKIEVSQEIEEVLKCDSIRSQQREEEGLLLQDQEWNYRTARSEGCEPGDYQREEEILNSKFEKRREEEKKNDSETELKNEFQDLMKEHQTMETALHNFMEKLKQNQYARFLQDKEEALKEEEEERKREEKKKREGMTDEQRFFKEIIQQVNRRNKTPADYEEYKRQAEKERQQMKKLKLKAQVRKLYSKIETNVKGQIQKQEKLTILKVVLFSIAVFCCCFCAAIKYKSF